MTVVTKFESLQNANTLHHSFAAIYSVTMTWRITRMDVEYVATPKADRSSWKPAFCPPLLEIDNALSEQTCHVMATSCCDFFKDEDGNVLVSQSFRVKMMTTIGSQWWKSQRPRIAWRF